MSRADLRRLDELLLLQKPLLLHSLLIVAGADLARVWVDRVFPDLDANVRIRSGVSLLKLSGRQEGLGLLITIEEVLLPAELVEDRLVVVQEVLIASSEPLDDLGEHASTVGFDQARDDLIGYILSASPKHLLKLSRREALDNDVLLLFLEFVLLLKVQLASLRECRVTSTRLWVPSRLMG